MKEFYIVCNAHLPSYLTVKIEEINNYYNVYIISTIHNNKENKLPMVWCNDYTINEILNSYELKKNIYRYGIAHYKIQDTLDEHKFWYEWKSK